MFTSLFVLGAIIILALMAGSREKRLRWTYRPYRLCMNCFTVSQPLLRANNEMYCSHCQRIDPAPLQSPAAQEYFRTRNLIVPEHRQAPALTVSQQRWRMGGAAALIVLFGALGFTADRQNSAPPAAPVTAASTAPAKHYTIDEFAALRQACGAPLKVIDKDASKSSGKDAMERDVTYRRVEFMFLHDSTDNWTLTGSFRTQGDTDTTLDHGQALKLMPCLSRVRFQVALKDNE